MQPTPARARPGLVVPGPDGAVREIVVVGAHGGAGTTTLAVLLQPAWDMGTVRCPARGRPVVQARGRPITLVTRNTAAAAARATAAVNAISWQGESVAVLAIVSDGLPEPVAAVYRFQLLAARVGAIVRVPFVASLRAADDPALADLPRSARRSIAGIRAEALRCADGPASMTTP